MRPSSKVGWSADKVTHPPSSRNATSGRVRFGDPVPNVKKTLFVESVSEEATEKLASATTATTQAREHTMETISLPRGHVVVRAFYGDAKRQKGKDVTEKVRALIAGGKEVFARNSLFAQFFYCEAGERVGRMKSSESQSKNGPFSVVPKPKPEVRAKAYIS